MWYIFYTKSEDIAFAATINTEIGSKTLVGLYNLDYFVKICRFKIVGFEL